MNTHDFSDLPSQPVRTVRWYQSERPAAWLPERLQGSRYGSASQWRPEWAAHRDPLVPFECPRCSQPPRAA